MNNDIINDLKRVKLLDSELLGLEVKNSFYPLASEDEIEITLSMKENNSDKLYKIICVDVQEYAFSSSRERGRYDIERFKIFNLDKQIVLSLDPYTEDSILHERDNDWIIFKSGIVKNIL